MAVGIMQQNTENTEDSAVRVTGHHDSRQQFFIISNDKALKASFPLHFPDAATSLGYAINSGEPRDTPPLKAQQPL